MELSFYHLLQNYFWDRKAFVLIFFSFGYRWDYFALYKEQVFFSTFFTIYNESKLMRNYP